MTAQAQSRSPVLLCKALGCRVNQADLAATLEQGGLAGLATTDDPAAADAALLFTCTVTHKADADVRKLLSAWRRSYPRLPVVVSGCLASAAPQSLRGFANVKAVVATGERERLVAELWRLLPGNPGQARAEMPTASAFRALGRQRALLKIQDGCHNRCSYCIVSRVRGPERSLPPGQVQAEVRRLLAAGHREIVLCGIHLGRYGREHASSLAALLHLLASQFADGRARVRLSSLEPDEIDDKLLQALRAYRWVCPHFHVPLQSGADEILAAMGRRYRRQQALAVLRRLRREFPEACLGTDLIVGFPGEDEHAFTQTLSLVRHGLLDRLHVFTFSPRQGTPAAELPGRPPSRLVRERASELRALGRDCWQRFLDRAWGRRLQVLVEKTTPRSSRGLSACYRPVTLSGGMFQPGQLVWAEVTGSSSSGLRGRVVEREVTWERN